GLVLYLSGDLLEFRLELAAVVGAEEQFSAAEQDDAQVCLGATAVAAIGGRQRARGGQNSSHVASSLARRAVVPGSTSNQAQNVPARGFFSKKSFREVGCCRLAANVPYCVSDVSYGFASSSGGRPSRLGCRSFMRTCPEPKWFMPRRERDVGFTPSRDRTGMRLWSRVSGDEGGVTTALSGLGTLSPVIEAPPLTHGGAIRNSARSEPRDRRDVRAVHSSAGRSRPRRFQLHRSASARPRGARSRP